MAKPHLHIDADASYLALQKALLERGLDVTRTLNPWMPLDASDKKQLLEATAHGRCIFTFNVGDFSLLAKQYPNYQGIILAHQGSWTLSALIAAVDNLLSTTETEDWIEQARWLNEWRE